MQQNEPMLDMVTQISWRQFNGDNNDYTRRYPTFSFGLRNTPRKKAVQSDTSYYAQCGPSGNGGISEALSGRWPLKVDSGVSNLTSSS